MDFMGRPEVVKVTAVTKTKPCVTCGAEFPSGSSNNGLRRRYCSDKCSERYHNRVRSIYKNVATRSEAQYGEAPEFVAMVDAAAIWLACAVDGEGTITIVKKTSKESKLGYRFQAQISMGNTSIAFVNRFLELIDGQATVTVPKGRNKRHKPIFYLVVRSRAMKPLLERILPHLVIKQRQAELVIKYRTMLEDSAIWQNRENHEVFEEFYLECRDLNKRGL